MISNLYSDPNNHLSVPVLHPPAFFLSFLPSFLPFRSDIMLSEVNQLGVRVQNYNIRVRDSIVNIENGRCINFGRFDEAAISDNAIDISIGVSITSSTDPIEMALMHNVSDVNRAYVNMLLTNVICGNIVLASSAD